MTEEEGKELVALLRHTPKNTMQNINLKDIYKYVDVMHKNEAKVMVDRNKKKAINIIRKVRV